MALVCVVAFAFVFFLATPVFSMLASGGHC